MEARIPVVEAVDVAQDDEQVGVDQVGDQGREVIVIPELDLLDHDGVVFVDDRDDAELQEAQQGVAGMEVAIAVGEVVAGEENLGDLLAVESRRPARSST
jgi:hypothetical protein